MERLLASTACWIRYEVHLKRVSNLPSNNQIRLVYKKTKVSGKTKVVVPVLTNGMWTAVFEDEVLKWHSTVFKERDRLNQKNLTFEIIEKSKTKTSTLGSFTINLNEFVSVDGRARRFGKDVPIKIVTAKLWPVLSFDLVTQVVKLKLGNKELLKNDKGEWEEQDETSWSGSEEMENNLTGEKEKEKEKEEKSKSLTRKLTRKATSTSQVETEGTRDTSNSDEEIDEGKAPDIIRRLGRKLSFSDADTKSRDKRGDDGESSVTESTGGEETSVDHERRSRRGSFSRLARTPTFNRKDDTNEDRGRSFKPDDEDNSFRSRSKSITRRIKEVLGTESSEISKDKDNSDREKEKEKREKREDTEGIDKSDVEISIPKKVGRVQGSVLSPRHEEVGEGAKGGSSNRLFYFLS
eukprot:TRINITY_DN8589_c0_g2_i2.p1 TRINITY_DN8589_c0_g2~~TRINITY_DN8589_c0_g2_i2.p1  ORF type:complete len:408 (-),score=100.69 TRINITY_DN8589_c0_g2_i2:389-1612(-)